MNALSKLNYLKYSATQVGSLGWLKKLLPYVIFLLGLSPLAVAQAVP
jgi:hypothetical protein